MEPPEEIRILCGPDEDPAVSSGGVILSGAQPGVAERRTLVDGDLQEDAWPFCISLSEPQTQIGAPLAACQWLRPSARLNRTTTPSAQSRVEASRSMVVQLLWTCSKFHNLSSPSPPSFLSSSRVRYQHVGGTD
jgi:hypothetical protein